MRYYDGVGVAFDEAQLFDFRVVAMSAAAEQGTGSEISYHLDPQCLLFLFGAADRSVEDRRARKGM